MPKKREQANLAYWQHQAKGIVRSELGRRGVTYAKLAVLLQTAGINETQTSLANKISRGTFSFVFFLQVMRTIGATDLSLVATQKVAGVLYSGEPQLPQKVRREYNP